MKATLYGILITFFANSLVSYANNDTALTYDQKIIAMTILGEARNQGEAGMYAVACVIQKRATNRGISARAVCKQDSQFSCWNKNDPNRAKLPGLLNSNNKQAQYAKRLALNISKLQTTFVNNADHYCTLSTKPYWGYKTITKNNKKIKIEIKPVKIIGHHKFYKLR